MNFLNLAKKLVNDSKSCVTKVKHSVTIALQPSFIGKETQGVVAFLQGWKNHYVKRVGGIVLGYDSVKFLEDDGEIISDLPYIYYQVSANFYIFKPVVGEILFGIINKISQTHAGCLVHGCINVSLTLDKGIDEATIDNFVCIGQEMAFKITSVDAGENNMRIRGRITHECLQILKDRLVSATKPSQSKIINGYTVNTSDEDSEDEFFAEPKAQSEATPKIQVPNTPNRKRNCSESIASTNTSGIFSPTTSSTSTDSTSKKKRSGKTKPISNTTAVLSDSGVESIAANTNESTLSKRKASKSPKSKKDKKKKKNTDKLRKSYDVDLPDEYGLEFDPEELKSLIEDLEPSSNIKEVKKKLKRKHSLTEGNTDLSSSTSSPVKKLKRLKGEKEHHKKKKKYKCDEKPLKVKSCKTQASDVVLKKTKHKSK